MPDITMCTGEGCPIKKDCYRHCATANEYRQSYFMNPPYKLIRLLTSIQVECDYFWPVSENKNGEFCLHAD